MIGVSEKAIEKIKELSESEGIGHCSIRVKVIGAGCAGFAYDMYFDDQISDMDESVETEGIQVIIDPLSIQYLENVQIDYVEGPISAGFKFLNPNVKSTCGCGSSFSV